MSQRISDTSKNDQIHEQQRQRGGIGYVLLWLLGVPIPVLILISLVRGCA